MRLEPHTERHRLQAFRTAFAALVADPIADRVIVGKVKRRAALGPRIEGHRVELPAAHADLDWIKTIPALTEPRKDDERRLVWCVKCQIVAAEVSMRRERLTAVGANADRLLKLRHSEDDRPAQWRCPAVGQDHLFNKTINASAELALGFGHTLPTAMLV